ncbi:hypothetical protein M1N64_03575, partial [Peptococcaceae bacterium]|nr:hypothetical protein [Peptococcaceae bacterium]
MIDLYKQQTDGKWYFVRRRTVQEVFDELIKLVKKDKSYPDEEMSLMFNQPDMEFPEYRWIACYFVSGNSEGYYIHVDIIYPNGARDLLFLGKTLYFSATVAAKIA